MAEQSSSSSVDALPAESAAFARRNVHYDEEQVRTLRKQGVEAERADKWEDATEAYSKALEVWYAEIRPLKRENAMSDLQFPPPAWWPCPSAQPPQFAMSTFIRLSDA